MIFVYFSGFRTEFLRALSGVGNSASRGYFINSCYAHCQTEMQETWLRGDSPVMNGKVNCFLLSLVALLVFSSICLETSTLIIFMLCRQ